MKSLFAAAAAVAAVAAAAPAFAQDETTVTTTTTPVQTGLYGTLGYAQTSSGHDVGEVQGRLGYRFGRWFGVEGELGAGVKSAEYGLRGGGHERVNLEHQEAVYGVVFVPLSRRFDLLARGGFGNTKVSVDLPPGTRYLDRDTSWNYGAGVQFKLSDRNGIRADWTRIDYRTNGAGRDDVWAVSFAHHF